MLTIEDLRVYYIFEWKPEYIIKYKPAQEIKNMIATHSYHELEEEDIMEVLRMISYSLVPVLGIDTTKRQS
jgi:hypothetical protein